MDEFWDKLDLGDADLLAVFFDENYSTLSNYFSADLIHGVVHKE